MIDVIFEGHSVRHSWELPSKLCNEWQAEYFLLRPVLLTIADIVEGELLQLGLDLKAAELALGRLCKFVCSLLVYELIDRFESRH